MHHPPASTRPYLLFFIACALLAPFACPQEAYAANPVRLQPTFNAIDCPFPAPVNLKVQCGYLEVPEDRSQPGARTIRLMVAILKSTSPHPQPDPLIFLQGGPGMGAVGLIPGGSANFLALFLLHRDVILFDQRGTGLSDPLLNCPQQELINGQFLGKKLVFDEILPQVQQIVRDCREALLARDIRLESYNSTENAADVEDLRLALGYEQVNLYGISYGTRLALTVLRDHPQGLRSVILNSTFPPAANPYRDGLANMNRAFETLFQGCQIDFGCRLAYPNLRQVFYDLVDHLNALPVTVQVDDPQTGKAVPFTVTGDSITSLIFGQLYNTGILGRLPGLIYDAADGDYTQIVNQLWKTGQVNNSFATGMAMSVLCREEAPFAGDLAQRSSQYPAALRSQIDFSLLSGRLGLEVCKVWDVPAAPSSEEQPVAGSVFALILAGEYDPVTPPDWGRSAAAALENAYFYELPGVGHGVLAGGTCPQGLMLAFLNNPSQPPDASCIARMDAPKFTLRARLARPWVVLACLLLLSIFGWTGFHCGQQLWQQRDWLNWSAGRRALNIPLLAVSGLLVALSLWLNATGHDFGNFVVLVTARVVETIIPLMLAIQVSQAFSPEEEQGMEVLLACPRPPAWLLLERLGPALAGQTLIAVAGSLVTWGITGGLLITDLLRWIPPALFMGGLALYMNMTTRRSAFSLALSVLMWWAMSFMGVSLIQRWPVLWPLDIFMQPEDLQSVDYILNRLFISLAGIGLALLAARILQDEERTLTGTSSKTQVKNRVFRISRAERNSQQTFRNSS
jgi:pimeloyl-ACP methyl ester carboxylesterase